jgi:putative DNA primase/helicase
MTKPTALKVQFENIPMDLKKIPRWLLWKFVEMGEGETKRWSKLPRQANGQSASSTNPDTWTDFLTAQSAYEQNPDKFDGVGFVFDGTDNIIGVDLDDCYDDAQGAFINAALQHIADSLEGYMEVSPSGTGVKIFTRADLKNAHYGVRGVPKGSLLYRNGSLLKRRGT